MKNMRALLALVILVTMVGVTQANLIITEIMKEPLDFSDTYAEWFEIYNDGGSSVDLTDYTISDNDGQSHTITGLIIGAGDVATLGNYHDGSLNGYITHDYVYSGINMDDGADEVILRNAGGALVDEVWYDDGALWPDGDGASIMLTNFGADNNDPANWTLSSIAWAGGDFGSPGEVNEGPYTAPNLVITEIMYDPNASSDTYGEWFEVYNAGADSANMRLMYLTDDGSNTYRWTQHFWVQAGDYAIIAKYHDPGYNGGVDEDWVYSGTNFDNADDEIILTDHQGNLIDEVWYDEGSGWPEAYGASIYLNNLGADNNDPNNWEISTVTWAGSAGDFGSPGEVNQAGYTMPDLVISEIMYDPYASSDTYGEWFEVYNAGLDSVNFRLWEFTDNTADIFIPQTDYWVQPGEYFVFAKYGDPGWNGGVDEDYVYGGTAFDDDEDEIIMHDIRGNLIDMVEYSAANLFPDPYGASIFLTDLDSDNSIGTNWAISTIQWPGSAGDFGSPGEVNQAIQPVPNIIITEILADPYAATDTYAEWFELYNAESDSVNMRYWDFMDNDGQIHTITDDLWIHAGEYFVMAKYGDPGWNGGVDEDYTYSGFNLDDTEDEIIIIDNRGNMIDEVWYDASFIKHFGASFYLLDLEADNNVGTNWAISDIQWSGSVGDFGSPGEANQTPQPTPQVVITEIMINPDASTDTYGEWFELYNAGGSAVNMRYWEFYDNGGQTHTITGDIWIASNEYLVFAKYGDPGYNGGVDEDYVYSGINLDDIEDELIIEDIQYQTIDEVGWWDDPSWPHPVGASIYVLNPFEDNSVGTAWTASTEAWPGSAGDFGSPGVANASAFFILTPTVDTVPVDGGDIVYDARLISNLPNTYENIRYWTEVTTPSSYVVELSSVTFTLYPFMDVTVADNHVTVPGGAPGGTYTFTGRVGYPTTYVSDSFEFTKAGASADGWTPEQWENLFGVAGEGDSITELPLEYEVGNAYPNPFNPSATIEIALPDAGQVNVVVYNTIGQRVETIADASFQAGWHSFTIDGSALASGVYFVKVDVIGQSTQMQKIVLMK